MVLSKTWHGLVDAWKNNGLRPPWVPTFEDVTLMRNACPKELFAQTKPRVLILGVTPALVLAHWLDGFEIKAADFDGDMIEAIWPKEENDRAEAVCANWANLPFPDDYFDLVIGDGSFCALPGQSHYPQVLSEILRVKSKSAPIIARFFVRQEPCHTFSDIVDLSGRLLFADHDASELRFLTVLASCNQDGTMDHELISGKMRRAWGDPERFIASAWPDEDQAKIFRLILERKQSLNFPTLKQIDQQVSLFGLRMTTHVPNYRLGKFCPTIRFDG